MLSATAKTKSFIGSGRSQVAIVGKLHVLREIQPFDGGDVPEIKEPDIGQNFTFKDKTCDNSAKDINVYLEIRCCVNSCQLR
jgi:hypothetical protein